MERLFRVDVEDLIKEISDLTDKLEDASAKCPSMRIVVSKGYSESFSSLTEIFVKRAEFYKVQLRKLSELLPKGRRKRKPRENNED